MALQGQAFPGRGTCLFLWMWGAAWPKQEPRPLPVALGRAAGGGRSQLSPEPPVLAAEERAQALGGRGAGVWCQASWCGMGGCRTQHRPLHPRLSLANAEQREDSAEGAGGEHWLSPRDPSKEKTWGAGPCLRENTVCCPWHSRAGCGLVTVGVGTWGCRDLGVQGSRGAMVQGIWDVFVPPPVCQYSAPGEACTGAPEKTPKLSCAPQAGAQKFTWA